MTAGPRILILYTKAGGGHESVARALAECLRQRLPADVALVNPYRDVAERDVFPFPVNRAGEQGYNALLKHPISSYAPFQAFYPCALLVRASKAIHRRSTVRALLPFWRQKRPDLVVSVMPWVNDLLADSLALALPDVPLVTVMTDYDECAPGMWLSSPRQILVCPSEKAGERARHRGHPPDRIHTVSGLVVSQAFYDGLAGDRGSERARLGLQRDVPTGLVMFGRQGASRMMEVARSMARTAYAMQLVFICGDNPALVSRLGQLSTPYAKSVHGLVSNVARYMALADFFIGKPGPSSIAEALASGLPMALEFHGRTMLQERFNAKWVSERGAALPVTRLRDLPQVVGALLAGYEHHRAAALTLSGGQAALEIADLVKRHFTIAHTGSSRE